MDRIDEIDGGLDLLLREEVRAPFLEVGIQDLLAKDVELGKELCELETVADFEPAMIWLLLDPAGGENEMLFLEPAVAGVERPDIQCDDLWRVFGK